MTLHTMTAKQLIILAIPLLVVIVLIWSFGTAYVPDGVLEAATIAIILVFLAGTMEGVLRNAVLGIAAVIAIFILAGTLSKVNVSRFWKTARLTSPASSACPGGGPKLMTVGHDWKPVNPDHPDALCDFSFEIKSGSIEIGGPDGQSIPDKKASGFVKNAVITKVRALSSSASIAYILCPYSKGPHDGSWSCRS